MSQLSADDIRSGRSPWASKFPAMRPENITLAPGSGAMMSGVFVVLGLIGVVVAFLLPKMMGGNVVMKHALSSVHVGAMTVLAASLGGLFFCMVFHLVNAGWSGTVRRQFENLATLVWVPLVFLAITLGWSVVQKGETSVTLFPWMGMDADQVYLLGKKAGYLNIPFFLGRAVIFGLAWILLAQLMANASRKMDETGDKRYAASARTLSAPGMVVFALTIAFAAFDWLKSMDYTFFSTMWGVYYFAGAAFTATTVVIMIHAVLRIRGKNEGVVTEEHFHDMGKLCFTFTCFWAYISFFQYFLIWYANIPEETAFYIYRKQGGWEHVFTLLAFGHFVVPFVIMIFRPFKKNHKAMLLMGAWLVFMQIMDIVFIVRPAVYAGQPPANIPGTAPWLIDLAGTGGVILVFLGLLIRKVASGPLVPLQDPRMHEALKHKNYV
ncbi:MAG: hypothetical protein HEQ23_07395 [Tepidisphaera sp.]|jgi:hypothetical protein